MSRKDYVAIAAAIREAVRFTEVDPDDVVVMQITQNIANVLEDENPNFNRERFLAAALGGN